MGRRNIWLLVGLIGITRYMLAQDTVLFQKVNEVGTARAFWRVTFVIDLSVFDNFLIQINQNLLTIHTTIANLKGRYTEVQFKDELDTLEKLRAEVEYLMKIGKQIRSDFSDYKLLHKRREKRSGGLIPILGDIISFMTGLTTEKDFEEIKRSINMLQKSQEKIIHVVTQGLSILNTTRHDVMENRHTIEVLRESLLKLDLKLANLKASITKMVFEVETFVHMYVSIDLIMTEQKNLIDQAYFYLRHLKIQLSFLMLRKITPEVISPSDLRDLLTEISSHLPKTLSLISPLKDGLAEYYEELNCKALLDEDQIVVMINIPLLEIGNRFQIFQIHNLPMPLLDTKADQNLIAFYNIETPGLAIDRGNTRYAPLTQSELLTCGNSRNKFCSIRSPLFPVNLAKLCVVKIFIQDQQGIKDFCTTQVRVDFILPSALYLFEGKWAVITKDVIKFSVVCHGTQNFTNSLEVKPPIHILNLQQKCVAINVGMTLSSFYREHSRFKLTNAAEKRLHAQNLSQSQIWSPLKKEVGNYSKLILPPPLKKMKSFPMGELITTLNKMSNKGVKDKSWPMFYFVLIGIGILVILGGFLVVYKKSLKCRSVFANLLHIISRGRYSANLRSDGNSQQDEPAGLEQTPGQMSTEPGGSHTRGPVRSIVSQMYPALDVTTDTRM